MSLIDNESIERVVREISPTHIAVAYIGLDWHKFIDAGTLQKIILSPTLGSNPWAIQDLRDKIGWDSIFFLDDLHAKIYIGKDSAAIGSFNLSRNGFNVSGLREYGVKIETPDQINQLREHFKNLLGVAKTRYPDAESKERRLLQLEQLSNLAAASGLIEGSKYQIPFQSFKPLDEDHFYVVWYTGPELKLDPTKTRQKLPELPGLDPGHIAVNWLNVLDDDPIEEHKWMLLWPARADGYPDARTKPTWLYVDQVVRDVVDDETYRTLVLQLKKSKSKLQPEPFSLDSMTTQSAIKKCLALPEFKAFRANGDAAWAIKPTFSKFKRFHYCPVK